MNPRTVLLGRLNIKYGAFNTIYFHQTQYNVVGFFLIRNGSELTSWHIFTTQET